MNDNSNSVLTRDLVLPKYAYIDEAIDESGTVPKEFDIGGYVNKLLELNPSLEKNQNVNAIIENLGTLLRDSRSHLGDVFNAKSYPESHDMYRIAGLIEHDFNHSLNDVISVINYISIEFDYNGIDPHESERLPELQVTFERLVNFLIIADTFANKRETYNKVGVKEFMSTLDLSIVAIEIDAEDYFEFNSFEEFMSARTLTINAQRLLAEMNSSERYLKIRFYRINGDNTVEIIDNATRGTWEGTNYDDDMVKIYKDSFIRVLKTKQIIPGIVTKSGGKLAAQLAGQRAAFLQLPNHRYFKTHLAYEERSPYLISFREYPKTIKLPNRKSIRVHFATKKPYQPL